MLSSGVPCGDTVSGDSQVQLGAAWNAHVNSCSDCQQKQAAIREEWFGPNTKDPRDD